MPKASPIPVAVSVFPDELYPAPRSWTEQAYPKLIHYNKARQRAGTLRLGNSRNCFQKMFAQASDRYGRALHKRGGKQESALSVLSDLRRRLVPVQQERVFHVTSL